MKNLIVSVLFSLISALTIGTAAIAEPCLRVYCKEDTGTKVKNASGHGKFFAAKEISKGKMYYLGTQEFITVRSKCGLPTGVDLVGTDADKAETITSWLKVKMAPQGLSVPMNTRCQAMEKK